MKCPKCETEFERDEYSIFCAVCPELHIDARCPTCGHRFFVAIEKNYDTSTLCKVGPQG